MPFVCAHKYFGSFFSIKPDFLISVKKRLKGTAIFAVFYDRNCKNGRRELESSLPKEG